MKERHANITTDFDPRKYYYRYSWLQLLRPMTLIGTIAPILAGTGLASLVVAKDSVRIDLFIALLVSAILIQAATNMLNDYYDFKNGQDQEKWVQVDDNDHHGPGHPMIPYVAVILLLPAVFIGIWLALATTLWVILTGVLGITAGYAYSAGSHSFASIGLGELIGAIFLGPVIFLLAYGTQNLQFHFGIIMMSIVFAFLISSMILTNNIRDLEKDQQNRNTLAHVLGRRKSVQLLTVLVIFPYIMVLAASFYQVVPYSTMLVALALPTAIRLRWSFRKKAHRSDEINGMKWVTWHYWIFAMLLVVAIWFIE